MVDGHGFHNSRPARKHIVGHSAICFDLTCAGNEGNLKFVVYLLAPLAPATVSEMIFIEAEAI
jgi:hypothetical protein